MARRCALLYKTGAFRLKIGAKSASGLPPTRESGRSYIHTRHIGQQARRRVAKLFSQNAPQKGKTNLRPVVGSRVQRFFKAAQIKLAGCTAAKWESAAIFKGRLARRGWPPARQAEVRWIPIASQKKRPSLSETAALDFHSFRLKRTELTPQPPPRGDGGGGRRGPTSHPAKAGSTSSPFPWR